MVYYNFLRSNSPTIVHLRANGSYSSISLHKPSLSFDFVILNSCHLLQNFEHINSPSDCVQFPISDNEWMMMSSVSHISDWRNSTVNWSWGVETQTVFMFFITKYIMTGLQSAASRPPSSRTFASQKCKTKQYQHHLIYREYHINWQML